MSDQKPPFHCELCGDEVPAIIVEQGLGVCPDCMLPILRRRVEECRALCRKPVADEHKPPTDLLLTALRHYASREAWASLSEGIVAADWCSYADPLTDGEFAEEGPWTLAQKALKREVT